MAVEFCRRLPGGTFRIKSLRHGFFHLVLQIFKKYYSLLMHRVNDGQWRAPGDRMKPISQMKKTGPHQSCAIPFFPAGCFFCAITWKLTGTGGRLRGGVICAQDFAAQELTLATSER